MKEAAGCGAGKTPLEELAAQAERFAKALDAEAYVEAQALLAADCLYDTGQGIVHGAEPIVGRYREMAEVSRKAFEGVEFSSGVIKTTRDGATILFSDRVTKDGASHTYRCKQHLFFNKTREIIRIDQEELPGERRRLIEFCARHGIEPSQLG